MVIGMFGPLSLPHCRFLRLLQRQRRHMMPPFDTTAGVDRASGRWKDVLPDPIVRGLRVFPLQGIRQIDTPKPCLEIARMELLHLAEMLCHPVVDGGGQHRDPIVRPLPSRTVSWWVAKSMSLIRNRRHSISRRPAP